MPVTCYICGRDFGTKSIGIHLPNCQKKWDAEQEKLPKSERRQLPSPPKDYDKLLSGELKGRKALAKLNQQAADDFNESALVPCQHCSRTFLPKALASHQKLCTEHSPMIKKQSYTGEAKARVRYPSLKKKTKTKKNPKQGQDSAAAAAATTGGQPQMEIHITQNQSSSSEDANDEEKFVRKVEIKIEGATDDSGQRNTTRENKEGSGTKIESIVNNEEVSESSAGDINDDVDDEISNMDEQEDPSSSLEEGSDLDCSKRSSFVGSETSSVAGLDNADVVVYDQQSPVSTSPVTGKPPSAGRGPGTLKKRGTFTTSKNSKDTQPEDRGGVSRDDLISFISGSPLLHHEIYRARLLQVMKGFVRQARADQISELLSGREFEDEENMSEAVEILTEFVKLKSN